MITAAKSNVHNHTRWWYWSWLCCLEQLFGALIVSPGCQTFSRSLLSNLLLGKSFGFGRNIELSNTMRNALLPYYSTASAVLLLFIGIVAEDIRQDEARCM